MNQRYIGLLLIFSISFVYGQNSTGINTITPSTKAALDIRNSAGSPQGVLFPRLPGSDTLALKTGVTAREKGLTFFDTTNNVYRSWNGTRWVTFGSGSAASGEAWGVYGNTLVAADTGYVSGFKYIGTNNSFPFIIATDGVERMRVSRTGNVAIGMKPSGGIPLQLKSNGVGQVFRIEKSGIANPLFEFRQNTGNHARFVMYDGDGSPTIELNADPASNSYFNVAKIGIGNNLPTERLHITNGALLLEGQVNSPTAAPTSGAIKFQGASGLNHAILNEVTSNDLVFWHRNGAAWNDNTRFNTIGEFRTGKVGAAYGFIVDGTGNAVKINNVTYSWPTTQASGVLTNDGTGGLTWATGGGLTGTGSVNTVPYWISTGALGFSTLQTDGTTFGIGVPQLSTITFRISSTLANSMLVINSALTGEAVYGLSNSASGGVGVHGSASGGRGVYGQAASPTGIGGYFENSNATGVALATGGGYVGIANSNPVVSLDVEGALATRSSATTLTLAASELSLNLTNISFVRANCASPTLLKGIKAGANGQHVFLRARAGTLTVVNSSSEAAAVDQIVTGSGADITYAGSTGGVVHLIYEINRWYVVSPAAATPASLWTQSGTDIYNANAGNVGIGTAVPTGKLHIATSGTTTGADALSIIHSYSGTLNKRGIYINLSADGSGAHYGIYNDVDGLAGDPSALYGNYNNFTPNGTGAAYGSYTTIAGVGTGIRYGAYYSIGGSATNTSNMFGVRVAMSTVNTGNNYGFYATGEDYDYFQGKVGIGVTVPINKLDVEGGAVIGATYSGTNTAPLNGLLVEGTVSVGTTASTRKLNVAGDIDATGGIFFGSVESFKDGGPNEIMANADLRPTTSGSYTIGTTVYRWGNIYTNAVNTAGNIMPTACGTIDLGSTALRFNRLFSDLAVSAVACTSDRRLKDSITSCSYGLTELIALRPSSYFWKKDAVRSQRSLGLIAQEVKEIIPEAILELDDSLKTLTINYDYLIPVLINGVQEQQKMIDSLKQSNLKQDLELQQLKGSIQQKDKQLDSQKTMLLKHEEELEKIRQYLGTEVKK